MTRQSRGRFRFTYATRARRTTSDTVSPFAAAAARAASHVASSMRTFLAGVICRTSTRGRPTTTSFVTAAAYLHNTPLAALTHHPPDPVPPARCASCGRPVDDADYYAWLVPSRTNPGMSVPCCTRECALKHRSGGQ